MSTGLMVTTCGRRLYLERSMESLHDNCPEDFSVRVMVDDSGDPDYGDWLRATFTNWTVISHPERCGLAAAVETGWNHLRQSGVEWIFHTEDDFTFTEVVPLDVMRDALTDDGRLAQVTLYRQAWSPAEQVSGGYLSAGNHQCVGSLGRYHLWHGTDLFSFNPSLYPAWVAKTCEGGLEADVTVQLSSFRFGVLTGPNDAPLCWHIGAERSTGWTR